MKSRLCTFNLYFILLCCFIVPACKTTEPPRTKEEKKKDDQASTIRLHLEVNRDGTPYNSGVPIYRGSPFLVNIERNPFLNEIDLQQASVVDAVGGFMIHLQFNRHGALILENVTTSYKGKRIAVHSNFGESRWLAAPIIQRNVSDGTLVFTPDATREEAERIVRGLNNLVAAIKKRSKY
jgi:hypothetical protein